MKIAGEIFSKLIKTVPEMSIGLDIGNSSVKLVQIGQNLSTKKSEIVNFSMAVFKAQTNKDIVAAIKNVIEDAKIRSDLVNTSVSGQAVIVRYVEMPRMANEELTKALKLGVGKYIPFNLDDVNYDFQILDPENKTKKMMKVLLVAVKRQIIQARINLLREAGLNANIIDVDCFATINSFELLNQKLGGIIAVLDIGADITNTTILINNVPYFNRDIPFGGKNITKSIIEEFEMTEESAMQLKHNPQEKYGEMINAIRPALDSFAKEIHMSFNYCESQLGSSVQKIYLTGGTAKFKGIDKVLSSIMGIEVEIWDPTNVLSLSEQVDKAKLVEAGPLLTVAIGLALRK
ncbi:MAG: type IV pilus assembly protein PilM [Candidatus Omnitrophica bacterium]|nr:type IV pilus assembly protein PilM [Candidatus Omnitrophota bacterium]